MSPLLLLRCVSVLCIATTAGSTNYGHPLHKRQADESCEQVGQSELCDNGFSQDIATQLLQCGDTQGAIIRQSQCRVNSAGDLCGALLFSIPDIDSVCSSSPANCTPECRDLLTTTRAQLGCCVNILNDSINGLDDRTPFRYSLWSLCGVEPVAEQCAPSPIELPTVQRDPACSPLELIEPILRNVVCRRTYVESSRDALSNAGCENTTLFDQIQENCFATVSGQYCNAMQGTFSLFQEALGKCNDTSMCDPLCIEALNNLNDSAECCLRRFNSTTTDFLTFEFWSRCDLITPGMCELLLTDDPTPVTSTAPITDRTDPMPTTLTDDPAESANRAPTLRAPGTITGIVGALCMMALRL